MKASWSGEDGGKDIIADGGEAALGADALSFWGLGSLEQVDGGAVLTLMMSVRLATEFAAMPRRSPRWAQNERTFFWQVFFNDRNESRQRRPSSLLVPPLILRRVTGSRTSCSETLVSRGTHNRRKIGIPPSQRVAPPPSATKAAGF